MVTTITPFDTHEILVGNVRPEFIIWDRRGSRVINVRSIETRVSKIIRRRTCR